MHLAELCQVKTWTHDATACCHYCCAVPSDAEPDKKSAHLPLNIGMLYDVYRARDVQAEFKEQEVVYSEKRTPSTCLLAHKVNTYGSTGSLETQARATSNC